MKGVRIRTIIVLFVDLITNERTNETNDERRNNTMYLVEDVFVLQLELPRPRDALVDFAGRNVRRLARASRTVKSSYLVIDFCIMLV
jgi:hypothetical protein